MTSVARRVAVLFRRRLTIHRESERKLLKTETLLVTCLPLDCQQNEVPGS